MGRVAETAGIALSIVPDTAPCSSYHPVMPFPDLQSFVAELERRDQLRRVTAQVDPVLEISAIADRVMKSLSPEGAPGAPKTDPIHGDRGGRALLFENVK